MIHNFLYACLPSSLFCQGLRYISSTIQTPLEQGWVMKLKNIILNNTAGPFLKPSKKGHSKQTWFTDERIVYKETGTATFKNCKRSVMCTRMSGKLRSMVVGSVGKFPPIFPNFSCATNIFSTICREGTTAILGVSKFPCNTI